MSSVQDKSQRICSTQPEEQILRHSISEDFESCTDVTVERGVKRAIPSPEFNLAVNPNLAKGRIHE